MLDENALGLSRPLTLDYIIAVTNPAVQVLELKLGMRPGVCFFFNVVLDLTEILPSKLQNLPF